MKKKIVLQVTVQMDLYDKDKKTERDAIKTAKENVLSVATYGGYYCVVPLKAKLIK